MKVKFLDLQKINEKYRQDFHKALDKIIDSGWFVLGESVQVFENNFSNYIGVKHSAGVANGLDALKLVLLSWLELGLINKGDEVLVPSNTYIATILAVSDVGLSPVLVEPDINTLNMDLSDAQKKLSSKSRCILPVHLYGRAVDMTSLMELANQNDLLVLEDCAQAHGATWNGQAVGSFGHASAFSFYPGKNLGALGDGGMVVTNDSLVDKTIRALRNYGSERKYFNKYKGLNSRLDELQAAFLDAKLFDLDYSNVHRRKIARIYLENLDQSIISVPSMDFFDENVFHLFPVLHSNRDELASYLLDQGIQTMIHYPVPPHLQDCYKGVFTDSYPVSEKIHSSILSLPIGPTMTKEEAFYVCESVNRFGL